MFDNDDKQLLAALISGEKDFGKSTTGDSAFVNPADVTQGGPQDDQVPQIREKGEQVVGFDGQFVADDKLAKAINQFEDLDPQGKEAFLAKLGIDASQVSVNITKKDNRLKPVEKRKASRNLLNEREKSITTDVLKTLGLNHKGRNFNKMFENFVWVKRKVSNLVNETLEIERDQRKEITNLQFEDMEKQGLLKAVERNALKYFKGKLGK